MGFTEMFPNRPSGLQVLSTPEVKLLITGHDFRLSGKSISLFVFPYRVNTKSGKTSVAKSLAPGTTSFQNRPEGAKPPMIVILNRCQQRARKLVPTSGLSPKLRGHCRPNTASSAFCVQLHFFRPKLPKERVISQPGLDRALGVRRRHGPVLWMHNNHQTGIALHVLYPNPCGFPGQT